ncbi:0afcc9a7-f775-4b8c-b626-5e5e47ffa51d [Sclerotinia trifoliorum]|uniref:0afcc9a7-f775-4b8c-b626-5e5e47ffa51d n=1 Tax=Sclerotinia trifoliorum TaxID=28548 RepID=A0A8H2ZMA8_9HELO|nr:0afcc9a7-f775-4b8c-b626-5e5e47ffa51d [Sclerotinia trifoliorum]
MESPTKGQEISNEPNDVDFEVDDDYSEGYSEAEEDDFIVDDENDDVVYEPGYDPDQELQQRRARLDYKLKSTFESIFEKYGKDFDGVGDEIDLLTGEILVDNGHLKEMQDERDAGDNKAGGNLLTALTVEPESVMETSDDEYSIEEGEGMNEGGKAQEKSDHRVNVEEMSCGDMEEDDMILRGYDESNRDPFFDVVCSIETEPASNDPLGELQYQRSSKPKGRSVSFPSYNEILHSFGPDVAPQIVNIISRKHVHDDTHIEPAWRVPELPTLEPRKRPALRPFIPEPRSERSPSPAVSESIWALPRGRGPGRPRGCHKPKDSFRPRNIGDTALLSDGINTPSSAASKSPRVRNTFTEEEDKILITKVAEARDQGLAFGTESTWEELASLNGRHTIASWKKHYRQRYLHLWSPEGITTPGSPGIRGPYRSRNREESESSIKSVSRGPHPVSLFQRPSRTRKPAQQGPNVVSWSDAVAAIKTLDPRLHKDLVKDASIFDLTDVGPVDIDDEALNLRSSDLEMSEESDNEPELPAHIGSGVQRIAPVTVNPAYEFSDEETGSNFKVPQKSSGSTPKPNEEKGSWLVTPQSKESKDRPRKPTNSKSKDGTNGKSRSHQSIAQKRLISEEVDELSLGLGEEDVMFVCSLSRKDKQKEPRNFIKRKGQDSKISDAITPVPRKERIPTLSDFEFDELSAEWAPILATVYAKKPIVEIKSEPDPAVEVGLSDNKNETNVDLFDIDQLPETSPRSALDARNQSRINKRFSSSAVIPSTSQIESSPTIAVDKRIQSRIQQRTGSIGNGSVLHTSSDTVSSPTPRAKRKFFDLDEKENTSLTPSQKAKTSVSDIEDLPLENMISGKRTPTLSPNKKTGGLTTPTHSESRKSRTPLLDYTTPTRRDLTGKRALRGTSQSPGMVKTPGGTFRKCGQDGFACKRAFCFRCGLSSKRTGIE